MFYQIATVAHSIKQSAQAHYNREYPFSTEAHQMPFPFTNTMPFPFHWLRNKIQIFNKRSFHVFPIVIKTTWNGRERETPMNPE